MQLGRSVDAICLPMGAIGYSLIPQVEYLRTPLKFGKGRQDCVERLGVVLGATVCKNAELTSSHKSMPHCYYFRLHDLRDLPE